jgi:Na+(H+)/acetate symporter ActP
MVAVVCLIVASVTYVIGQMTGVGVAFSRFLEVSNTTGLLIGAAVVFMYAVLGGMKGITYTQVAQYCVLITAYTIPAVFISLQLTGNAIPGLGLFGDHVSGEPLLARLDQVVTELGFAIHRAGLNAVQRAQHDAVHLLADDRHRRSAARHHPVLHGAEGGRCPLVGRLGAGVHRAALPHCSRLWAPWPG